MVRFIHCPKLLFCWRQFFTLNSQIRCQNSQWLVLPSLCTVEWMEHLSQIESDGNQRTPPAPAETIVHLYNAQLWGFTIVDVPVVHCCCSCSDVTENAIGINCPNLLGEKSLFSTSIHRSSFQVLICYNLKFSRGIFVNNMRFDIICKIILLKYAHFCQCCQYSIVCSK